jgi:RNA polymerase sigma-70 factor, ECF subfamily
VRQTAHTGAKTMSITNIWADFEKLFLPHLDAAYNLARLLTRNARDAEDMVQESYLKAWRSSSTFSGKSSRPWILTIVRNTCFTFLRDNHFHGNRSDYQENLQAGAAASPEAASREQQRARAVEQCVRQLPADFRETLWFPF